MPGHSLPAPVPDRSASVLTIFSLRLEELLRERGETQIGLARLGVVKRSSLSDYMRCASMPPADVIVALAEHFSVSADYLLGLTDVRSPIPITTLPPGTVLASAKIYRRWKAGRLRSGVRVGWTIPDDVLIVPAHEVEDE